MMRPATVGSLLVASGLALGLLTLGCAGRTSDDEGADESGSESESESGAETETETGGDDEPYWVYASTLHPRALAATATGVIAGGAHVDNFSVRESDVIALSEDGDLQWSATWLDEDRPVSVVELAWAPGAVWVGFEGTSCGDGCVESLVALLDGQGVEQWRLAEPIPAAIADLEVVEDDVVVVATNASPASSVVLRLDAEGNEVWRWNSPMMMVPPVVRDVVLGEDTLWGFGARENMDAVFAPWLAAFSIELGLPTAEVFAGVNAADGAGLRVGLLGDGFVVTQPGTLTALEIDGVRTWQVSIPDGICPIDAVGDLVAIGCESEIQLRDVQSTRIGHWPDLEETSADYYWQAVALGARVYAGIGSSWTDVELEGKVYGIEIE